MDQGSFTVMSCFKNCQVCWLTPRTVAQRLSWEGWELETSLGYIHNEALSQKKKKERIEGLKVGMKGWEKSLKALMGKTLSQAMGQ